MIDSGINVIKWPSRSPDLNILEDIWHIISNHVYYGPQFQKKELVNKLISTINDINMESRASIKNLYHTFRKRLVAVLKSNENLFNKWLFVLF